MEKREDVLQWMKSVGLTHKALAEKIGYSESTVRCGLNGVSKMSQRMIDAIEAVMTEEVKPLTITLPPENEAILFARAAAAGQTPDEFLTELIIMLWGSEEDKKAYALEKQQCNTNPPTTH